MEHNDSINNGATSETANSDVANGKTTNGHHVSEQTVTPNVASRAESLSNFLVNEIGRLDRETRMTWRIGGAIVIAIALYGTWIISSLHSTVLDPQSAGFMLAEQFRERAPQLIRDVEDQLNMQAQQVAEQTTQELVSAVPMVRQIAEEQIDMQLDLVPALREEVQKKLLTYFVDNRRQLRQTADDLSEQAFADYLIKDVQDIVLGILHAHVKVEGGKQADLKQVADIALQRLNTTDKYLASMVSKSRYRMNRLELLERRVIATWVTLISELLDEAQITAK